MVFLNAENLLDVRLTDYQPLVRPQAGPGGRWTVDAWAPLEGSFEITIGSDAPVAAKPGQAFFFKRGTPHGFRNVGATAGAVMEIFVKQSAPAADLNAWLPPNAAIRR